MSSSNPSGQHGLGDAADAAPALPASLTPIQDILENRVMPGRLVGVAGLVKDCQLPIPTKRTGIVDTSPEPSVTLLVSDAPKQTTRWL